MSRRVVVLGAGVSGLTTSRLLQDAGYAVTIVSSGFGSDTTSTVAGALWEWPPAVCGFYKAQPDNAIAQEKEWSVESYRIFTKLQQNRQTGVHLRDVIFYLEKPLYDCPMETAKVTELSRHVRNFRCGESLINRNLVDTGNKFVDAYAYEAPMIDTEQYLSWLLERFLAAGGNVCHEHIQGDIREVTKALLSRYQAYAVFNCTGLGAAELTGDEVIPVRGGWLLIQNDGSKFPKIESAHCSSGQALDGDQNGGFLFIVPRGENKLILGGFAQPNQWNTKLDSSDELFTTIFQRCVQFIPCLTKGDILNTAFIKVGLRPFREIGVRCELEPGLPLIHNYGHGGSGVTLSWGAAKRAVTLLESCLSLQVS